MLFKRIIGLLSLIYQGLRGLTYIDKTDGGVEKKEAGEAVTITDFTDRVYKNAPDVTRIEGFANRKSVTMTRVSWSRGMLILLV